MTSPPPASWPCSRACAWVVYCGQCWRWRDCNEAGQQMHAQGTATLLLGQAAAFMPQLSPLPLRPSCLCRAARERNTAAKVKGMSEYQAFMSDTFIRTWVRADGEPSCTPAPLPLGALPTGCAVPPAAGMHRQACTSSHHQPRTSRHQPPRACQSICHLPQARGPSAPPLAACAT